MNWKKSCAAMFVLAALTLIGWAPPAHADPDASTTPSCQDLLNSLGSEYASLAQACNPDAKLSDTACQAACVGTGGSWDDASKTCGVPDAKKATMQVAATGCYLIGKKAAQHATHHVSKPKPPSDFDQDGIPDFRDDCPEKKDGPKQADIPFVGNQTGEACDPQYLKRVKALLDESERIAQVAKANDLGTAEKLDAFIKELKALLKKGVVTKEEWKALSDRLMGFEHSMMQAFACLSTHQFPTFAVNGDGDVTVTGCKDDPAWLDMQAALACLNKGPGHQWVPRLDEDHGVTGEGTCVEDKSWIGLPKQVKANTDGLADVNKRLDKRLVLYSATEGFGQGYLGTGYGAAGIQQSLGLGLDDHWSLEGALAFGLAIGEKAPSEGKAIGGGFSFHYVTGSSKDSARFDLGLGGYGMQVSDPRFNALLITYGLDVKPAVRIRLSDMFSLRLGADVGQGQCVPKDAQREWCLAVGGFGGLIIGGR